MWLFDDREMTEKELLEFANDGGSEAVRHFPDIVLASKSNMLVLVKNGYANFALAYCSEDLKKDVGFLKEVAQAYHYTSQDSFFKHVDKDMQKNKELLEIFAAKADDPRVKESQDVFNRLNKVLKREIKEEKKTPKNGI